MSWSEGENEDGRCKGGMCVCVYSWEVDEEV